VLVPSDGGEFRPLDPTSTGPDVTVVFDAGTMTITAPAGTTIAARTSS
jgi:hypothetical protein